MAVFYFLKRKREISVIWCVAGAKGKLGGRHMDRSSAIAPLSVVCTFRGKAFPLAIKTQKRTEPSEILIVQSKAELFLSIEGGRTVV